jgi:hypothetical protein
MGEVGLRRLSTFVCGCQTLAFLHAPFRDIVIYYVPSICMK